MLGLTVVDPSNERLKFLDGRHGIGSTVGSGIVIGDVLNQRDVVLVILGPEESVAIGGGPDGNFDGASDPCIRARGLQALYKPLQY